MKNMQINPDVTEDTKMVFIEAWSIIQNYFQVHYPITTLHRI